MNKKTNEKKSYLIAVDKETYKKIRILAINHDLSVKELLRRIVKNLKE